MRPCTLLLVVSSFVCGQALAVIPVATGPGVIWHGDFEGGLASLNGNEGMVDGYRRAEIVRPEQIQMVTNPLAEGQLAARFEVRHDDVFIDSNGQPMSESRTLLDPSLSAFVSEGDERWYRWQVLLPNDYKADYPKWDELGSSDATTTSRSYGGYNVEWHHDTGGGSAPLYLQTKGNYFTLCLVNPSTQACGTNINLTPLVRGRWVDWTLHAKWSSDPTVGYLEVWADGALVLPRFFAANMYAGARNYWTVGLYRNGHIGDPTLRYTDGTQVYPTDPVTVVYLDGFVIGSTPESISGGTVGNPPPPPPSSGNLITNGNFANGMTGWANWDLRAVAVSGSGQVNPGCCDNARFAQTISVAPNVNYTVSFQMATQGVTGSFQVKLLDNTQGGLSRLQQNLTYASTQPFTTYRFTANSGNSTSLTFYVGNWAGSTGTANFTNISVAAPQNLITNGTFANGMTGWANWDPRAVAVSGSGQVNPGCCDNARFAQTITVDPNVNYTVSFQMATQNVSGNFQVKLLDNAQGGLSRLTQNLTYASTQGFTTYSFTANSGNSTSLTFYVGNWAGSTGTANFTNISVTAP